MKYYVVSLGCPKNLTDTEVLMGKIVSSGHQITTKEKDADAYIVNTCAFLKSARKESIDTIRRLQKKGKPMCVAGCLPKWITRFKIFPSPSGRGARGVGIFDTLDSIGLFNSNTPRIKATNPWTAYVKIAEGCDNQCSYCLIPKIRGRFRARKVIDILAEVRQLAKRGVREIIFVAQDTTAHPDFASLLRKTARIKGVHWIRVMYAYPKHLSDRIINVIKTEPKIVKYIDLPVQHICDNILKLMNRPKPLGKGILNLIHKLRREIPSLAIRTSLIVGFPGEKKEDFKKLVDFVKQVRFERLGVFEYSKEDGTPASNLRGQVPDKVKRLRFNKLMSTQNRISRELHRKMIGKIIEILYEGMGRGRAAFDAPEIDGSVTILRHGRGKLSPGEFAKVKITNSSAYGLTGRLLTT